jgi:hypothetical protein
MKSVVHMTDAALEYAHGDCFAAISANPESLNTERYLKLARDCSREQVRRSDIRILRMIAKDNAPIDELTVDLRHRQSIRARQAFLSAHGARRSFEHRYAIKHLYTR